MAIRRFLGFGFNPIKIRNRPQLLIESVNGKRFREILLLPFLWHYQTVIFGNLKSTEKMPSNNRTAWDYAFDNVLVWKFARSTKHLLAPLEVRSPGVRFVSIQDQIDTTSPTRPWLSSKLAFVR